MSYVKREYFDSTKNLEKIYKFTITNKKKTEIDIINYGATIISFRVKSQSGQIEDIVLGYDNLKDYEEGDKFFGCTIGRYANRISKSSFKLNDQLYLLNKNEGENHLHGGNVGFHKKVWNYEIVERGVAFTYTSPDMEEGYPGECSLRVEFTLNDDNELHIDYIGKSSKDTILNPTNHSYFNLNGHDNGTIFQHSLMVNGDYYTPVDKDSIPTGEICKVDNTPFDLREAKLIEGLIAKEHRQLTYGKGLDHNICINGDKDILRLAAVLESAKSSRKLSVYTSLPGIQVYTGNNIGQEKGKGNSLYENNSGICLETQYYPDSINIEGFESPILKVGDIYRSKTIYKVG